MKETKDNYPKLPVKLDDTLRQRIIGMLEGHGLPSGLAVSTKITCSHLEVELYAKIEGEILVFGGEPATYTVKIPWARYRS